MPRVWTPTLCWIACLVATLPVVSAQAAGLGETLLPDTTKGFISITDVQQLSEHWNRTQVGQLMKDPVMEPFAKDLRRQLEDRWSGFHEKLGLTLDDLKDVPGGEVSVGVVHSAPDKMAFVILVDITDHQAQARAMLEKVTDNLVGQGAKRAEDTLSGTRVIVLDLPKENEDDQDEPRRQAIYFRKEKENLLGASDDLGVMEGVLARLAGGLPSVGREKAPANGRGALAEVPAFQAVMQRCQEDAGDPVPQIRWFLEPFGYFEAMRTTLSMRDRPKGKPMLEIFKNQGFTAIQGIGGFVDFAVDGYELIHRTVVFAPQVPPYEKSMKMLVFPNSDQFAPQPWVPRDIATYCTFYGDVMNAFDNFGPLFDELFGEGETGVWEDVLDGLKNDPNGPKIDLRAELFTHLANRVTVISDYQLPITTASERLLFAVEAKDQEKVTAAITKTLKNDKEMRRREFNGHVIWETIPKEKPKVPTISLGSVPPLVGEEKEDQQEEVEPAQPLLPNAAVTVACGNLMVASHYDFLIEVLEQTEKRETLARDVDYLVVENTISEKLGAGANCVRTFARTDEQYRPTYELIRQGKMPESETMLGRILNTVLGAGKKGVVRTQEIDGSKLPDYDFVRRHLGSAGMFGTSEESGWFLKGFMLGKQSP